MWDCPPTKTGFTAGRVEILCAECNQFCDINGFRYNDTTGSLQADVFHDGKRKYVDVDSPAKDVILMLLEAGDRYGRGENGCN